MNKGEIQLNNYNMPCRTNGPTQGNCGMKSSSYMNYREREADELCSCKRTAFPVNTALVMAYVPFQQSTEVYSCEKGLARGTIFTCLDKPFLMGCCK